MAGIDGLGHGARRRAPRAGRRGRARAPGSSDLERSSSGVTTPWGRAARRSAWPSSPPPTSGMTWLGVGNVEGRVLSGDPSRPAEGLARARARRSGARAAAGERRRSRSPGRRPRPGHRRHRGAFADAPDISGSPQTISERILAVTGSPRTTPSSWRSATSVRGMRAARAGRGPFRAAYAAALADYLRDPTESVAPRRLRARTRGGRPAAERARPRGGSSGGASSALGAAGADRAHRAAAGDFFLEGLSTFEMVQRGFREAREAASQERRQTELSRQLSTFLADASLALDAQDSLQEMLPLVAEQARELVGADCCVARWRRRTAAERRGGLTLRPTAVGRRSSAGSTSRRSISSSVSAGARSGSPASSSRPPAVRRRGERPLHGWLAASLTALDGSELGAIQLFDKQKGPSPAKTRPRSFIWRRWRRRRWSARGCIKSGSSVARAKPNVRHRPHGLTGGAQRRS